MAEQQISENNKKIVFTPQASLPPIQTVLTSLLIFLIIFALFSGATYQFYASFLFLFYSFIGQIWISVVCLGVFQTILMIPFRIISLKKSVEIKSLKEQVEKLVKKADRQEILKKKVRKGNVAFLWYTLNFFVQTTSYLSLGRLFLTDFYQTKLNPQLLYSFVSYPQYPIKGLFFKIPYPVFTETIDFGLKKVLFAWAAILVYKIGVDSLVSYLRKSGGFVPPGGEGDRAFNFIKEVVKFTSYSAVLGFILSYLLIRHFPLAWEIRIFSGDVSRPNSTLNLITAVATFLIILWLDNSTIREKVKIIRDKGPVIVKKMRKELYKNSFKKAFTLGLGAYFITNLVPCAFELSVFTLEIISFLSPFTLDRLIFRTREIGKK